MDNLVSEVYYKVNLQNKKKFNIIAVSNDKHVSVYWEYEGMNHNIFIDLKGMVIEENESMEKVIKPVIKGDFSLGGSYLLTGDYLSYKQDQKDNYIFSLYEVNPQHYKCKSTFTIYRLASVSFSRPLLNAELFDKLFLTYKDTRILSQWDLSTKNKLEKQYPLDVDLKSTEIKYLINESFLVLYGPVKDEDMFKICVYSTETSIMISDYKMEKEITHINFLNVFQTVWLLISIKDVFGADKNYEQHILRSPYSLTEGVNITPLLSKFNNPFFYYEEMGIKKERDASESEKKKDTKCESASVNSGVTNTAITAISGEVAEMIEMREDGKKEKILKIIEIIGNEILIKDFSYNTLKDLIINPTRFT
ncbi:12667_t:CDS:2, partial [Funneliformis mosseae]